MDKTELQLRGLEELLLSSQSRKSMELISSLLDDSFVEFGSSGQVYNRMQTMSAIKDDPTAEWHIKGYRVTFLSSNIALATFRTVKADKENNNKVESLRSSIWRKTNSKWKLVFHQGTGVGEISRHSSS